MTEIKFFTTDLREGVLAEFTIEMPGPCWTHLIRGQIIHSLRDKKPVVMWPKAGPRFAHQAVDITQSDIAKDWVMASWRKWCGK
jgi:hypothetical protein